MAGELLQSFANTYRSLLSTSVPRSDLFSSFTSKISGIISCIRPVLDALSKERGIIAVLCCQSDHDGMMILDDSLASATHIPHHQQQPGRERLIVSQGQQYLPHHLMGSSTHPHHTFTKHNKSKSPTASVLYDSYTILSSHDALLNLASEVMSLYSDHVQQMTLTGKTRHVFIQRYYDARATMIVLYDAAMEQRYIKQQITDAAHLLHKGNKSIQHTDRHTVY